MYGPYAFNSGIASYFVARIKAAASSATVLPDSLEIWGKKSYLKPS